MKYPLTRVLSKVIVKGFYRQHTGLLLSLFIVVFINFFYTNVLNQTHLTPAQIIENALKMVLTTVTEPLGVVILFGVFLMYTIKSWQYVAGRLREVDVQFLFYSSNALPWQHQLRSWAVVQSTIALPITILGGYTMGVGLTFGHWLVPLLIPIYILGLNLYSAAYYTRLLNDTIIREEKINNLFWLNRWPKPIFSLFFYEVITKKRIAYAIAKTLSLLIIAVFYSVLPDSHADARLLAMIGLCIALAHVILIYQLNDFELFYLRFTRNLPYGRWQLYGQQIALFGVLLLPEIAWFMVIGELSQGLTGIFLMLSVMLLFRALLYRIGQRMNYYLRLVFGLFIAFLLINMFGLALLLAGVNVVVGLALLYWYQYRSLM